MSYINIYYYTNTNAASDIIISRLTSKAAKNLFPFIYKFNSNYPCLIIFI